MFEVYLKKDIEDRETIGAPSLEFESSMSYKATVHFKEPRRYKVYNVSQNEGVFYFLLYKDDKFLNFSSKKCVPCDEVELKNSRVSTHKCTVIDGGVKWEEVSSYDT